MDEKLLKRLLAYERARAWDPRLEKGWNARLFDISQDKGDGLVAAGVLRHVPGRGRRYLFVDREATAEVLKAAGLQPAGETLAAEEGVNVLSHDRVRDHIHDRNDIQVDIPDFDDIVGYDDVKLLISESLRVGARVHYLLLGPPGSAKTLFLFGIEGLTGSSYVLGSRMSRSGLSGFLMDEQPKFLLVDEVDKLPARDLAPLLSLTEAGRIVETLNRRRREAFLDTIVFAAANSVKRIPGEVLSRFQILEFPEYTRDEFIEVCKRVLVNREGLTLLEAGQVAVRVNDELRSKDVRMAVRVARLARTNLGVDGVVEIFKNYSPGRRRR